MPRVLPWLAEGARRERRPARPTRRESHRTPSPGPHNSAQQSTALQTTPRHLDVLRSSRSPPTSPIEAPPTEEYIKEGFDNDDMYIMVEDEFYAIAQQFTRHLHHAEYIKGRKQAKTINAAVLRDMERPTDQKTSMSRATLKRKESELLRERQRRGLAPMSRRPRTGDDDDEEDDTMNGLEEEEEREDDPWFGTSLHSLMASPRKNRSLAGLQSIRSSTRAAAGFRSAELAISSRNNTRRPSPALSGDEQPPANEPAAPSSSSDDDDDLEIIESRSSRPNPLPQSDMRVRTSLVKRESPERDIKPTIQRHSTAPRNQSADTRRRVTISGDRRTSNDENVELRTRNINGHIRSRDSDREHKRKATRHSDSHTISIRPRKRILLDDLDDVVTVDIKAEDEESKDCIIQGQPRRSLSTTKDSRSTYRTTDRQQQKATKRSRLNDIPTFLV